MTEERWLIADVFDEKGTTLVDWTLVQLYGADLVDVIDTLVARVIGHVEDDVLGEQRAHRLVDESGQLRHSVESLLHEIAWTAFRPNWTRSMKQARALEVIGLAGF
jgi:hypothetical protein